MKLVVTIDVEEEGLFSRMYESEGVTAENVGHLTVLDPVFKERGIRPTLLVSYQACQGNNRDRLMKLREEWDGEIGAHLHPWNTPPLADPGEPEPAPSERRPAAHLEAKLESLLTAIRSMGVEPRSFRMGRFNLGPRMFSILEKSPIQVDSSMAPMRSYPGGPDHLRAPADPYFPDPSDPVRPGGSNLLEVPITVLPLVPGLGGWLEGLGRITGVQRGTAWLAQYLGSISVQPMGLGLKRLKAAARLHASRGGRVLTMFFHSSELMPGGCPQHQTRAEVEVFLDKIDRFFSWLNKEMQVESVTLSGLRQYYERSEPKSRDKDID